MSFGESNSRILNLIYQNPGIRFNELMKKGKVSFTTAKKIIDYFLGLGVINDKKVIGGKRVVLRTFYPNFFSEDGRNVFSFVELEKKYEFFKRNKNLVGQFRQLLENINKGIRVVLVFGSFVDSSQTRDSDLDILFLYDGRIDKNKLKKEIERSFVTFNHEVSIRIENFDGFRQNINKGIYETIVKNHVIIKGSQDFFRIFWEGG